MKSLKLLAGLAIVSLAPSAHAQPVKSGEAVYKETCFTCHAAGVAGAPKFADKKAWAPLIAEGQAVLTSHAWVGVRAMPAKGGKPDMKLEDFARAVVYMTQAAGGKWKDPDAAMLKQIQVEEKKRRADLKTEKK